MAAPRSEQNHLNTVYVISMKICSVEKISHILSTTATVTGSLYKDRLNLLRHLFFSKDRFVALSGFVTM